MIITELKVIAMLFNEYLLAQAVGVVATTICSLTLPTPQSKNYIIYRLLVS